eukprot:TRINITY_DN67623_c0_g1_i1.p1 TRINITY_DN67623_c0_g1~~TRINITY_DN67623_c0_g1_i1.p1  ORF type:complete len:169 (-),score=22.14 TRINITY_DN67623_c0_g1_i1:52-558(-)
MWSGGIVHGNKVYCCPDSAESILVFDITTQQLSSISTRHLGQGREKWQGFAAVGDKLYAPPLQHTDALVFDTLTGQVSTMELKPRVAGGWWGLSNIDSRLFAAPALRGFGILAFHPDTGEANNIDVRPALPVDASDSPLCGWASAIGGTLYVPVLESTAFMLAYEMAL